MLLARADMRPGDNRPRKEFYPAFGVRQVDGMVRVDCLCPEDIEGVELSDIYYDALRTLVYTLPFADYDGLIIKSPFPVTPRSIPQTSYLISANGFWGFVKKRLMKYQSISNQNLPLYIKEYEYRYSNINKNINIINIICNLV